MSCSVKPISNPLLSMSNFLLSPSPTIKPKISLPFKPIILHLSTSFKPFSLRRTAKTLTLVASQEDDTTSVLQADKEDEEEEEEVGWGSENQVEGSDAGEWGESPVEDSGEGYSEPPEDAKIFVGNLPYDVDSEQLAQLFQQAGVVEISEVIYNRETDQSRGFGFVTMSTVEEAEKAVEMLHRYELGGRNLTVNKAAPRGSRPERGERSPQSSGPSYRVYVGNLPWDVDDGHLEQVFSEHGKVVSARVVYDRESGRSRGFGFVTMSSESELNDAIENLDGQSLGGRAIRVNVAEEKPRRY